MEGLGPLRSPYGFPSRPQTQCLVGRADGRPANALHCNRPLEYAGFYLSKKSAEVHLAVCTRPQARHRCSFRRSLEQRDSGQRKIGHEMDNVFLCVEDDLESPFFGRGT